MVDRFPPKTAIGQRLRLLSAQIDQDAKRLYKAQGVYFEQRWFGFLNQIVSNGPMTVTAIAQALSITHASVSETKKSLESAGLVKSKRDENDGRQRAIYLTDAGQDLVDTLDPVWTALQKVSAEINEEANDVMLALSRLNDVLARKSLFERTMEHLQ